MGNISNRPVNLIIRSTDGNTTFNTSQRYVVRYTDASGKQQTVNGPVNGQLTQPMDNIDLTKIQPGSLSININPGLDSTYLMDVKYYDSMNNAKFLSGAQGSSFNPTTGNILSGYLMNANETSMFNAVFNTTPTRAITVNNKTGAIDYKLTPPPTGGTGVGGGQVGSGGAGNPVNLIIRAFDGTNNFSPSQSYTATYIDASGKQQTINSSSQSLDNVDLTKIRQGSLSVALYGSDVFFMDIQYTDDSDGQQKLLIGGTPFSGQLFSGFLAHPGETASLQGTTGDGTRTITFNNNNGVVTLAVAPPFTTGTGVGAPSRPLPPAPIPSNRLNVEARLGAWSIFLFIIVMLILFFAFSDKRVACASSPLPCSSLTPGIGVPK